MRTSKPSILYCGHSAAIITTEKGTRIAVDPWLEGNPSCPPELVDPGKIDLICLSHGHSDHTGSALYLAQKYQAVVFAIYDLGMLLTKDGLPSNQLQTMNKGGSVVPPTHPELKITLTHAFHSSSYDSKDGNTYYAGEPCGVVIELESKRRIYHAGDTALFCDMKLIQERFQPEIALLPIGDRYTMDPRDAAIAASWLKPEVAIPIHYRTFDALSGTAEMFVSEIKKLNINTKVVALNPGEEMFIKLLNRNN